MRCIFIPFSSLFYVIYDKKRKSNMFAIFMLGYPVSLIPPHCKIIYILWSNFRATNKNMLRYTFIGGNLLGSARSYIRLRLRMFLESARGWRSHKFLPGCHRARIHARSADLLQLRPEQSEQSRKHGYASRDNIREVCWSMEGRFEGIVNSKDPRRKFAAGGRRVRAAITERDHGSASSR